MYEDVAITQSTVGLGFSRIQKGDFEKEDWKHSGRPGESDEEQLNTFLQENTRSTIRKFEEQMNCDYKTVVNHIHSMGKFKKLGSWLPHALNHHNKKQ